MENIDLLITLTQHERDANNVTIAFTMGLTAANEGHKVELVLLSDAVNLAKKGYGETIDIGAPFSPVGELIPAYLEAGGVIKVCSACMEHNGVNKEDLVDGAVVINAPDVVGLIMGAKKSLQLN